MPGNIRACLGRRMGLLRPQKGKVLPEYLLYAYLSPAFQQTIISNTIRGATVDRIALNELPDFSIRIPCIEEQAKVANLLQVIDAKIDCNNRINAELEAMAKTLYDYWFVQFDFPFDFAQGKPDQSGKPYKSSGGKMVYNSTLKQEIPTGWQCKPISYHLNCNRYKLGKSHHLPEIRYLDTANLTKNVMSLVQQLIVGEDNIPSRANMVVMENDILFSTVRPNQCHYGLIKRPVKNMIASTGFAVFSHKHHKVFNDIFYLFLTHEPNIQRLIKISESSKSSYPSISPEDIKQLNIALPDSNELLEKTSSILNPIFDKLSVVQQENLHLTQLRDWLLPMLMNGQVTVS